MEKRWKKPKTEPSEDATGLGPLGYSGRIDFTEIEVIEVEVEDDAVFMPIPKEDQITKAKKSPDGPVDILLSEAEALKKALVLSNDLQDLERLEVSNSAALSGAEGDTAALSGAKDRNDKDTKWPIVWCKDFVYLFARDEEEDVEETICNRETNNPLAIYDRPAAVRRFRKSY